MSFASLSVPRLSIAFRRASARAAADIRELEEGACVRRTWQPSLMSLQSSRHMTIAALRNQSSEEEFQAIPGPR